MSDYLVTIPDGEKIAPGPIRHVNLSPEMLLQIRQIFDYEKQFYELSLKKTELDFMRDLNPDQEINHWLQVIDIHKRYMASHPRYDAKQVWGYVVAIGCGSILKNPDWLWKSVTRFAGDEFVRLRTLTIASSLDRTCRGDENQ